MVTLACTRPTTECQAVVEAIREVFAKSSLFREARLSEPIVEPTGSVVVDVSFNNGPPVCRVVAPSETQAYATLHELARAMVEVDQRHRAPR
jgi:hypothetical protein